MLSSEMILAVFAPLLAFLPALAAQARALCRRHRPGDGRGSDELSGVAEARRLATIAIWTGLVVISIEEEVAPPRLPAAAMAPLLLAIYAAIILAQTSLWGLIYRRARGLSFRLRDYLRAALSIHLLVRPVILLLGFGLMTGIFLAPAAGGRPAAAAVAAGLLAIYAAANLLQVPIGRFLGALAPMPIEDRLAGAPGADRIRGLYALRTFGIGFANAFAYPATGNIAITTCALENLTPEETRAVLRHETGHLILRSERVWRWAIILIGAGMVAAAPFAGWLIDALRERPIVVMAGTLAVLAAFLAASRRLNRGFEHHADAFAAADPEMARALGSALLGLGRINGIPPERWRKLATPTHPAVEKRLEALGLPRE